MQIITTHINADFDTLASMLAAKKLYPDAKIVFPGSQDRSLRDFIIKSAGYMIDLEKAKNIDLKKVKRLIFVDVRQKSRIGIFSELVDRGDVEIHIYDHHPSTDDDIKGDFEVVKPVGSTTTILTHILKEKGIEITPDEATVLMLGIYEDTGSLLFPSTTEEDFTAAAYLLSKGANLSVVSSMLAKEITSVQIDLLHQLIKSMEKYNFGGIEVTVAECYSDEFIPDFAVIVQKMMAMEDLKVLLAIARMGDRVVVVGRSREKSINIGELMNAVGGGGHPTAGSATIKSTHVEEIKEKLIGYLREFTGTGKKARDMMFFPVKTVDYRATLHEASEILSRYNINATAVVDGDKVVGIISRQIIERARHHGLENLPVRDYMITEFETVSPDSSIEEITRIIIKNNQRFLPVLKDNRIVGAITRTDLLRFYGEMEILNNVDAESPGLKRDLSQTLEKVLPSRILELLKKAGSIAESMSFTAYVVGGFVRDLLLGVENLDIDIVVEGDGIAFARNLAEFYGAKMKPHMKFGTARVIWPDGFSLDVATARLEYYQSPGALPTIERGSIKLDLYRRDFTINALAIKLNPEGWGNIIDFFGGQKDLKERVIRVLHNLSFVEDPTRIFRALRLSERLGFQISKHTLNLMKNAIKLELLEKVSGKRIFQELFHILEEEEYVECIKKLQEIDALRFLHRKLRFNEEMERLFESIDNVISWYELLYRKEVVNKPKTRFYALTNFLNADELREMLDRLEVMGSTRRNLFDEKLAAEEKRIQLEGKDEISGSEIYNAMMPLSLEGQLFILAKTKEEKVRRAISHFFTRLKDLKTELTGKDLIRMGFMEGPIIGRILRELLEARLNGEILSRSDEENYVRRYYGVDS